MNNLGENMRECVPTLLAGRLHASLHEAARFYDIQDRSIGRALNTHDPDAQVARLLLAKYLRSKAKDKQSLKYAIELLEAAKESSHLEDMALSVAEKHGVKLLGLKGTTRTEREVAARHEFINQAYAFGYNLSEIGRYLGRDHKTIHYVINKEQK